MVFQVTELMLLSSESPDIRINGIELSNYFGGDTENYIPLTECYGYIDNLVVWMPTDDPVVGRNLHDPAQILTTPVEITDKTVHFDELITTSGTVSNTDYGGYYGSCIDETFLIDAGEGNNVIFTLDHYEIGASDFIFFYDGNTTDADMIRIVKGYEYGNKLVITSTGRYLFVRFSSNQDFGALGWQGYAHLSGEEERPPDIEAPSSPTGLQATNITMRTIDLSWNPAEDNVAVTGYRVFVNGSLDGSTINTSYSLTQLDANTTYEISVSAIDGANNESSQSQPIFLTTFDADVEAPSVPTGLSVSGETGNSLDLSWNPSSDNVAVTGYYVYVDGNLDGSSTNISYTVTGLNANTSYSLTVSAYDIAPNESPQSAPVTGTTSNPDNEPPTIPAGVTADNVTSTSISLTWENSTDNNEVDGYYVYANGLQKGEPFSNSFTITQLNPGITYNIAISAFDAASNESPKSPDLEVQTVNPDNSIDPTMPEVRSLGLKKSTSNVITTSEMTSLGHTDLQDYGVLYSKDRSMLELGDVAYGDPNKDSVVHEHRVIEDLQLLFDFSEGEGSVISDQSGRAQPFNLTVNKPIHTYWLPGQGMRITKNTMIYGEQPLTHLFDQFSSSNEITLEAWIEPASLNQSGPARIMTLSADSDHRAFSLMQEGNVSDFEYVVRLNTSTTDANGYPEISTSNDFFTLGLHHVVYTRNNQGEEYIYVNAKEMYKGERLGNLGLWAENNHFALANEISQDREWNGIIYLAAVYSRALDYQEIVKNYDAGFGQGHFTANIKSLETNIPYYMSPFIRTDQGIVYGEVEQFTIENVLHFDQNDSLDMALVPNPSDGSFVLFFEDSTNREPKASLRIADMSGQIIYVDEINLSDNFTSFEKNYNLSAIMRSGIYSVMLILGSRSKAQRLVIYSN